ncbi:hypothetical protein FQN54_003304 [Arachnomyces sp. PD_36]|nr:hypothetical protein FQN54_003304 [Arachnomyces sp. PD_36]
MVPPNRPRPRITWQMHVRRLFYKYIYRLESPLEIRGSLVRLRQRNKHPFLALLRLFIPLPTWHFSVPDPVPFKVMLNNLPLLYSRLKSTDIINMRCIPIWRARDTPIRSIYRIYEAIASRVYDAISPEVEYFFYQKRRSWAVHRIQDPCDPDPVRYAILASIAEQLADAFNWRMSLGMRRDKRKHIYRKTIDEALPPFPQETAPSWAMNVPAINIECIADLPGDMLDSSGRLVLEDWGKGPLFMKRNIVTGTGHFYTV